MKGKIKKLLLEKGYGFIAGDDGRTYFLHATDCEPRGIFDIMEEGMEVEFDWKPTPPGLRAIKVQSNDLSARLVS